MAASSVIPSGQTQRPKRFGTLTPLILMVPSQMNFLWPAGLADVEPQVFNLPGVVNHVVAASRAAPLLQLRLRELFARPSLVPLHEPVSSLAVGSAVGESPPKRETRAGVVFMQFSQKNQLFPALFI
jgi:hypothetical protein